MIGTYDSKLQRDDALTCSFWGFPVVTGWPKGLIHDPFRPWLCLVRNRFILTRCWPPWAKASWECYVMARCRRHVGSGGSGYGERVGDDLTLHETNIAPENWWLGDSFPFGDGLVIVFQRLCLFQGGRSPNDNHRSLWLWLLEIFLHELHVCEKCSNMEFLQNRQ